LAEVFVGGCLCTEATDLKLPHHGLRAMRA
jgi:hypothetical protein